MYTSTHILVNVCGGKRSMLCVLYGSPSCFRVMSLTDVEAHWLARLVDQWVQRSSSLWDYIVYHQAQLFAQVLGFKLRSSCFHSKHFTNWLISPVLILYQEVHTEEILRTNEWRKETQWSDLGLVETFSPVSILKHATLFPASIFGIHLGHRESQPHLITPQPQQVPYEKCLWLTGWPGLPLTPWLSSFSSYKVVVDQLFMTLHGFCRSIGSRAKMYDS